MIRTRGRMTAMYEKSLETATKRGEPWTPEEDDLLRSTSSSIDDLLAAAQLMERTMAATSYRFYKVQKADKEGRQLRYADHRSPVNYPSTRITKTRVYIAPACACADPWDHRAWCPDNEAHAA